MEPEQIPEREISTRFFIDELQRIEADQQRHYASLSGRVTALERKGKSAEDDPMKSLGSLLLIMGVIQLLPIVIELVVKAWKGSASSLSLPSSD